MFPSTSVRNGLHRDYTNFERKRQADIPEVTRRMHDFSYLSGQYFTKHEGCVAGKATTCPLQGCKPEEESLMFRSFGELCKGNKNLYVCKVYDTLICSSFRNRHRHLFNDGVWRILPHLSAGRHRWPAFVVIPNYWCPLKKSSPFRNVCFVGQPMCWTY